MKTTTIRICISAIIICTLSLGGYLIYPYISSPPKNQYTCIIKFDGAPDSVYAIPLKHNLDDLGTIYQTEEIYLATLEGDIKPHSRNKRSIANLFKKNVIDRYSLSAAIEQKYARFCSDMGDDLSPGTYQIHVGGKTLVRNFFLLELMPAGKSWTLSLGRRNLRGLQIIPLSDQEFRQPLIPDLIRLSAHIRSKRKEEIVRNMTSPQPISTLCQITDAYYIPATKQDHLYITSASLVYGSYLILIDEKEDDPFYRTKYFYIQLKPRNYQSE